MVKSLKFLRHRRTEAGYFSEFLIAKTPDDLENRAPKQQPQQPATATTIIFAAQPAAPTVPVASIAPAGQHPGGHLQSSVGYVSLYSLHPTTVARHEEVAPLSPQPQASGTPPQQQPPQQQPPQQQPQHQPQDPHRVARRRERNRAAAAKCRQRRQDRLDCLAECVRQLEAANGDLEAEVAELAATRARLEAAIGGHRRCAFPPAAAALAAVLATPMEDEATSAVWLTQPPSPQPPTLTKAAAAVARPTSLSLSTASDAEDLPSLLTTPRCVGDFGSGLTPLLATPQSCKLESMILM